MIWGIIFLIGFIAGRMYENRRAKHILGMRGVDDINDVIDRI